MKRSQIKRKAPDPQAQLKEVLREAKKSFGGKRLDGPIEYGTLQTKTWNTRKRNKYGAIKTYCEDIRHDSKLEAGHAKELRLAQKAGLIRDLEFQKDFVLTVNGKQICIYIVDFYYFHIGDNRWVGADSKGKETAVFKLKFKLTKAIYPAIDWVLFKKKWIEL